MQNAKINPQSSTEEVTPRCNNCCHFGGLDPSFSEGAPPAWCNPPGSKWSTPCEPGEIAINKPCYSSK